MGSETEYAPFHVVDFSDENMKPGTETWLSACHVVRSALEEHGCFLARYDRVAKDLCDSVVTVVDELFSLPLEKKTQKTSDKAFHGYLGQVSWIPLYESLGIDDPLTLQGCQKFNQIMWPEGNDRFCETVNEYAKLLGEIDRMAKRMVFESYGLEKQVCDSFIESSNYLLRCIKYRALEMDETNLGLQPHSDMTIISVVHQLNNLKGLEIKLKDGEWSEVAASPSLFVVMAGDALQVWSNGRIRTCIHKVMMNEKKIRYSMGLFSFAGDMIKIPEELVNEHHPLRYKQIFDHYDYLRFAEKEKIKDPDSRIQDYFGISIP